MTCDAIMKRVRELARDNVHGATHVTSMLGDLAIEADGAGCLQAVVDAIQPAQAGMGSVANLCQRLRSAGPGQARVTVQGFRQDQQRGIQRAVRQFAAFAGKYFGNHGIRVVTISDSSMVRQAISAYARVDTVIVGESRPVMEGRMLAAWAAKQGIHCELTTDAALFNRVSEADIVMLGCDALFPDAFVNKVGSAMLVSAARAFKRPVAVLADPTKYLEDSVGYQPKQGQADEVWDGPPPGVVVHNPYMEVVAISREIHVFGLRAGD